MAAKPSTLDDHRARIARAIAHLEQHLDTPLDVPELARVACLSPFHFHRVFRALIGESIMEHVRRLRLERAARALSGSRRSVLEISLEAGFTTHEAFTRAFTAHFGVAPSVYRSTQHQNPPPAPETFQAELLDREKCSLICLRHKGPYETVGATWQKFYELAFTRGLFSAGSITVGLCYDDPEITPSEKIRYEAGLILTRDYPIEPPFEARQLEPGRFAHTLHRGPFSELPSTYGALTRWVLEQELILEAEPSIERYLEDPQTTPAQDLRTEIYLRVTTP